MGRRRGRCGRRGWCRGGWAGRGGGVRADDARGGGIRGPGCLVRAPDTATIWRFGSEGWNQIAICGVPENNGDSLRTVRSKTPRLPPPGPTRTQAFASSVIELGPAELAHRIDWP
jgi:hypothetical protein